MGTVLKSSLVNLAATFVSMLAGFAVSILNARLLGPEGSGLAAFALWFAASLSALADRGMPQVLLRSLGASGSQPRTEWQAIARTAFSLFSGPVAAVGLATAAYGLWVWHDEGREPGLFWAMTLLLFLLYALSAFSTAAARGRGNFRETALSTVAGSLLQLPFIVAGALFFGAAGAIAGMAVRFVPQALRLRRYVRFAAPPRPESLTPDMRRHARQMWLSDMIDVILVTRIELVLLGLLFSTTEMGYFAAAAVFAGLVGQLALQLSPSLVVGFSRPGMTEDMQRTLFTQAMRLTALAVFPIGFGGAAIVPHLIPLVFGADFAPAGTAAALLLLSSAIGGIAVVPWTYLAATGGSGSLLRIMAGSAVTTVGFLAAAIWLAGLNGAALARILVEALTLTLLVNALAHRDGPVMPLATLIRTALAAGLCGLTAWATARALPGWPGVIAAIAAAIPAYLAGLRLFGLVTAGDARTLLGFRAVRRLPGPLKSVLASLLRLVARRR
ncbi:lipopolysaccharide biosynthesis protein [Rhizobiaceae bacterium BDR2-2]|uniref:Lipopolysaccharide biosynthesis protein n=1 Tax=Ectorhizobium quercum TaxID=2965071 RepID=A0AAE3SSY0_9HYPH|nr:lipopolysaccharide biosynthesis protein [Ectorhizobium quercum]MCX8995570.1 lipopolysaccharide biosynthesis protein [Ectorhizobium quercum]